MKDTLSRAVATFLITASRQRTWPEITSAAGLCSKGFQSISVACVRAQEPPGYCEIGLLGGGEGGGTLAAFPETLRSQEHGNYRAVGEHLREKATATPQFGHWDACVWSGADQVGSSPGCT